MKRVKMMLLSLLVLAVVGGTMAFKAKFDVDMCITPAREIGSGIFTCAAGGGGNITCPNFIERITTKPLIPGNRWCTTTPAANNTCPGSACLITVRSLEGDDPL